MRLQGRNGLALVMVVLGVLILLHHTGFFFGHLMSWIFPLALCGLGYLGLKHGSKILGIVFFFLGGIMLLGKLSGLIGLVIAIFLIVYGLSMFRGNRRSI